jgi:hypothetical protein
VPSRELIERLLRSPEPSVRWRTRVRVLGEDREERRIRRLEGEIRRSRRARALLRHRHALAREPAARSLYHYWQGLHWSLASLADIGYPPGDESLGPVLDRALSYWTQPRYDRLLVDDGMGGVTAAEGVRVINGRPRRCASIQGAALLYAVRLGVDDERTRHLARLLRRWQWPDGGWNCDRTPEAHVSSFMETLQTMRGLAAFGKVQGSPSASAAARRASEVFLSRRMYRRRTDGAVMRPDFVRLHYPVYWHYDTLAGLKGICDVGRIGDPRAREALDSLEERELPGGGWSAERPYYRVSRRFEGGCEYVDWGPADRTRANPWVTTDALAVLVAAGRFGP